MPDVFDQIAEAPKVDVFDQAATDLAQKQKATARIAEADKLLARFTPQETGWEDAASLIGGRAGISGTRALLTQGGKAGDVAIGVLGPIAGAVGGGLTPIPGAAATGGATASAAADALVQAREYLRGERDDLSKGRLLASAATGAFIPSRVAAAATPLATFGKTLAVRSAQGAGLGAAHEAISEGIDVGKWQPGQIVSAALLGSLFGAGFGVLEGSAPHIINALRGKTVAQAKQVIADELPKIDTNDALDAATKAQVRGVLEGAQKRIDDALGIKAAEAPATPEAGMAAQAAAESAFGGEAPLTRLQKADERAGQLTQARAEDLRQNLLAQQAGQGETVALAGDQTQQQLTKLETRPGESARERARLLAKQAPKPEVGEQLPASVQPSAQAATLLAKEGYDLPAGVSQKEFTKAVQIEAGDHPEIAKTNPELLPVIAKDELKIDRNAYKGEEPPGAPPAVGPEGQPIASDDPRRGYPVQPDLPKEAKPGSNIFRDFADAMDEWKTNIAKWVSGTSENKPLIWQEPDTQWSKGSIRALTKNTTDEMPWRVTTFVPGKEEGTWLPWGHRTYKTRAEAMAEEGRHVAEFHDRMPGRVLSEQEIQGYKLKADLPADAELHWYKLPGEMTAEDLRDRLRGTGLMESFVADSTDANGRIAFTQPIDEKFQKILGLTTEKPPVVQAASEGLPPSSETRPATVPVQAKETVTPKPSPSNREIADQRRKIRDMERAAKRLDETDPKRAASLRQDIDAEQLVLADMTARKQTGSRPTVGMGPMGEPDILTDIAEHVGTLRTAGDSESKTRAGLLSGVAKRLAGGETGVEWSDAVATLNQAGARNMTEGGTYNFQSVRELEDAISSAIAKRDQMRASLTLEKQGLKIARYQQQVVKKFIPEETNAQRLLAQKKARPIEEIGVGAQFKINGEKFSIVGVEETASGNYEYIVKDGHMFRVPEGTVVAPDKGRITHANPLSKQKDVGFLPPGEEAPAAKTPAATASKLTRVEEVWNAARATPDEFTGIDATNLTAKERRGLAARGLSFSEARDGKIIATYPAKLRAEDLKARVTGAKSTEPFLLASVTEEQQAAEAAAARERLLAQERKDKIQALAEKPLVGDSSDVGQGTLLAQDEDLLSGPSAETLRKQRKLDEAGKIHTGLLFSTPLQTALGGTTGAIYGSTKGDTLEERRQNMLLYGGAGMALGAGSRIAGRALLSRLSAKPVYEIDKHLMPPLGKSLLEKASELPNKAKAATITVFAPLDKLTSDIAKANAGVVSMLPREVPLSRQFEQVAGASGKAAQDVRDYVTNVLDKVGPDDRQNFDRIVALKRIEQRLAWNDANASDRKVVGNWTHQKVAADLAQLQADIGPQRVAELDAIASGPMQQEADDALRLQVASGRLSQEAYNQIKADNDFYAPFKVLDHMEGFDVGTGNAIDTRDQLAKAITGLHSEDFHIENPSVALAQHIFKGRVLAEKNLKMLNLAELADADVSGTLIRKLGPQDEPRRGYDTVNYFEDGKPMRLEVLPAVANAVKGLNSVQTGLLANFARQAGGLFRFGATTANVAFQPVNFFLADQPSLWLVSKYGLKGAEGIAKAPVDFAHGLYASIFSNILGGESGTFARASAMVPGLKQANDAAAKLARAFHESGATGSNWQELIDTMGGSVDEKRFLKSLKLGEHSLIDGVGAVNKTIEEATKLMGFKRGLRVEGIENMTGAQAQEALEKVVAEVRNFAGSPDFMRSGWAVRDLNNFLQMFLNARVQGVTNLTGRLAGADGVNAARDAWLRIAGTIGTGAAYLWYENHRPENEADFNSRSQTERSNYFLFPRYTDNGKPLYSTNEFGQKVREYWRMPKREVLQYLGNTVESALDFAHDKDPEAVARYGVSMLENLSPVNISGRTGRERMESVVGGANPLLKVPYEQLSGRDTFRHRDILPTDDLKIASPENQYVETTPKLLVRAAQAMPSFAPDNLRSPMLLQNLVEGASGRVLTQFLPKQQPEGRDTTAAALASNPLTARAVGSLYVDRSREQQDIDAMKRAEADVRVEKRRNAREMINSLKTMTPDQVSGELTKIATERPQLFEQIITEINKSERDVIDRQLLSLGVKNGARAQFIVGQLRKMKTQEQATEYLTRLTKGEGAPLTDEVFQQVVALMGSQ